MFSMRVPATIAVAISLAVPYAARAGQEQDPIISISTIGSVRAKPDALVLLMEVRATAPLAEDALADCEKKVAEVTARLRQMGVKDASFRFSGSQFTPAGGGRYVMPGGQRPTGFDVFNLLQIRIGEIGSMAVEQLNSRVASLLDDLGKAGASVLTPGVSSVSIGANSAVVFTLNDPEKHEKQAISQAIEKARPIAEEIAGKMGVKIKGLHSIRSGIQQAPRNPYAADLFDLSFASTSPEEITVRASVTVNFSYSSK